MKCFFHFLFCLCAGAVLPLSATLPVYVYMDSGCDSAGVPKWYVGGDSATLSNNLQTVKVAGNLTMPVNCSDFYQGTDAVDFQLLSDVVSGGYYDIIMKFPDDTKKTLTGEVDVRMKIKNLGSSVAKLRLEIETTKGYPNSVSGIHEIPVGSDWVELVVPLSEFTAVNGNVLTDSIVGVGFTYSWNYGDKDPTGSALHILYDNVVFTDGSDTNVTIPSSGGGAIPEGWSDYLMVGSFDNRENKNTDTSYQVGDYRYQYIMPETFTNYEDDYVEHYAERSAEMGIKSGFVWYNLGKDGEGSAVAAHLADATYMEDYVSRYENFLNQLVTAGQSDYIIILEPDMYGFLMQGKYMPTLNCAEVTVNMSAASAFGTYENTLCGMAQYLVGRAKKLLVKGVYIGHMLNHWGVDIPGEIGQGRIESHISGGYAQAAFLNSLGTAKGDVVFVEKADRDAGTKGSIWFWDSTNYAKYFTWVAALSSASGLRVVGWQISEGNINHSVAANRDDAVQYFVDNQALWAKAGFIGILFGAGMSGQCNYGDDNDDGWFLNILKNYMKSPYTLSTDLTRIPFSKNVRGASSVSVFACGRALCRDERAGFFEVRTLKGELVQRINDATRVELLHPGVYIWRTQGAAGKAIVSE